MDKKQLPIHFKFFNDVSVIYHLGKTLFEKHMPKGIKIAHYSVLNHLVHVRGLQTPLQIAKVFQLPVTTMTHTLAVLERRGLIVMPDNPQDGRSKLVMITNAGRELRLEAIAAAKPYLSCLEEKFPFEDVEKVMPFLDEMRVFLNEEMRT